MKEYDLIIFGEEIAGVWLLEKLRAKLSSFPEKKKKSFPEKILWLRTQPTSLSFTLPKNIALAFGITEGTERSLELAFPTKVFNWDSKRVDSYLSPLVLSSEEWVKLDKRLSRVRGELLRTHPELHAISRGIWTWLGMTDKVPAETELWASLMTSAIWDWKPKEELFSKTFETQLLSPNDRLSILESTRKETVILIGEQKVRTQRLLLNSQLSKIERFFEIGNFERLGFSPDVYSDFAKYRLKVEFEPSTYLPFQKSCLLFSQDGVVDTRGEFASLEKNHNLLWVDVIERRNADLNTVLKRFRLALKDLNRGFPILQYKANSFYPSLGMETCFTEENRQEVEGELKAEKRDIYRLSQVSMDSALPAIKSLSPNLNCHLPYPLGTLEEAKKLVEVLV